MERYIDGGTVLGTATAKRRLLGVQLRAFGCSQSFLRTHTPDFRFEMVSPRGGDVRSPVGRYTSCLHYGAATSIVFLELHSVLVGRGMWNINEVSLGPC